MSGRTRVAIVVDRIHDWQVSVLRGIEEVLHEANAALLVVTSHPTHNRHDNTLRRFVRSGKLQGVVVTSMRDVSTQTNRVTKVVELADGAATVTLGIPVPGVPIVLVENRGGIRAGATHVIDDCGRTRPILVAGTRDNLDSQEREVAFLEIAAERGLVLPDPPIMYGDFDRELVYRRVLERLTAGRDFDAVLAATDDMAMGVLDALNERGVDIPGEVAVVGLDNIAEAYLTEPPLSTIDVDVIEQGRAAARLVLAQLEGKEVPAVVRPTANLVVRASTSSAMASRLPEETLAALRRADGEGSTLLVQHVLAAMDAVTGAMDSDFQRRLHRLGTQALPKIFLGTLDPGDRETVRQELTGLVFSHPEPLWWRGLIATVESALSAASGERMSPSTRNGILRMTLLIDRALATVREQRDREVLALNENVLELNRALSRCRSLPELAREIYAFLPRLNVRRCFVVLLDTPLSGSATATPDGAVPEPGDAAADPGRARLVMSYRNGVLDPEPDDSVFIIDDLLPESLAEELEHGTLTLQPVFTAQRAGSVPVRVGLGPTHSRSMLFGANRPRTGCFPLAGTAARLVASVTIR